MKQWLYALVWIVSYVFVLLPDPIQGYLTASEVYSLVAFLLERNEIIQKGEVMDAKSLAAEAGWLRLPQPPWPAQGEAPSAPSSRSGRGPPRRAPVTWTVPGSE